MTFRPAFQFLSLATCAAVLTACGGGRDDAIDPYIGTFNSVQCTASGTITDAGTGARLFTKEAITYARSSHTKATGKSELQVYRTNTCTGTPVVTVQSKISLSISGTKSLGGKVVNLVTVHNDGDYFAGNSASPIVVNGVSFAGFSGVHPTTAKDLYSLQGNDLYMGDTRQTPDGQGYPSALKSSPSYRRK